MITYDHRIDNNALRSEWESVAAAVASNTNAFQNVHIIDYHKDGTASCDAVISRDAFMRGLNILCSVLQPGFDIEEFAASRKAGFTQESHATPCDAATQLKVGLPIIDRDIAQEYAIRILTEMLANGSFGLQTFTDAPRYDIRKGAALAAHGAIQLLAAVDDELRLENAIEERLS
jgi:hypothetical protein